MALIAVFFILTFGYSLVSARLDKTVITAPLFFCVAGVLASFALAPPEMTPGHASVFLVVAEVGLVMLLFSEASRTTLQSLRSTGSLSARLLGIGMVPTILLGAVAAMLVFPRFSFWEAGILAAILAPTDAGLGQVIVESPKVPGRIRHALSVEAGLNDGLSVPFLLFFMAMSHPGGETRSAGLFQYMVEQLGYGVLVGAGIGLVGGWLLTLATRRGWIQESLQQIAVVSLPIFCMLISEETGASMFIAAFVAGLAVATTFEDAGKHSVDFADRWGQFINLAVFFVFGIIVGRSIGGIDARIVLYAALSLTLVRIVPVAIATIGTGLSRDSVLFMGWFGPRGLASIVLALVYLAEKTQLPGESTIRMAVIVTVALSIVTHGASALPGIALYARRTAKLPATAPEHSPDS